MLTIKEYYAIFAAIVGSILIEDIQLINRSTNIPVYFFLLFSVEFVFKFRKFIVDVWNFFIQ
jgi:hypothetical protein